MVRPGLLLEVVLIIVTLFSGPGTADWKGKDYDGAEDFGCCECRWDDHPRGAHCSTCMDSPNREEECSTHGNNFDSRGAKEKMFPNETHPWDKQGFTGKGRFYCYIEVGIVGQYRGLTRSKYGIYNDYGVGISDCTFKSYENTPNNYVKEACYCNTPFCNCAPADFESFPSTRRGHGSGWRIKPASALIHLFLLAIQIFFPFLQFQLPP